MTMPYSYSNKFKWCCLAVDILIFAVVLVLAAIYSDDSVAKDSPIGVVGLTLTLCFLIVNLIVITSYFLYRKKFGQMMKEYSDRKDYDGALNFLHKSCKRKHLYSNYQMILFFLATFEFLRNNNENAVLYLKQIDIAKTSRINSLMMVQALFFTFLYGHYSKRDDLLVLANKANHTKKFYMENFPQNRDIAECVEILDLFENGNFSYAFMKLRYSRYMKFPFICDFCEQNQ